MRQPRVGFDATRTRDHRIAALAGAQDGVARRDQLTALGLSGTAVEKRCSTGRLIRVHRGVYAVGHAALSRSGRQRAALFACGDGALLTAATGGALWGLRGTRQSRIDVLVTRRRTPPDGVRLLRTRVLDPQDSAEVDGLPVTSVARTILEMAARLDDGQTERMLHRADELRLYDRRALADVLARLGGHRGAGRLRRLTGRPPAPTRSMNEQRFLGVCDRWVGERPPVNVMLHGLCVDAWFAAANLVVEIDCRFTHGPKEFETDRRRDERLLLHGIRTLRITDTRLEVDPDGVGQTLVALGARVA